MWYEFFIGAVSGTLMYMYMQYVNYRNEKNKIEQSVAEQIIANAKEVGTERESVEWLNFILKQWYLHVEERLQEKIHEIIGPTLAELDLPHPITGVELGTVSFGQNPPRVDYVQTAKVLWEDSEHLQGLRLILGPRINCPEFKVELKIKALGEVTATMTQFTFEGELRLSILKNTDMPFPCIQRVYLTFEERPQISFKISYGLANLGMIPGLEDWVTNTVEDVVSDTLVNPGRFYIDLSKGYVNAFLIKGVRKLKRTVLHLQIDIGHQNKDRKSDKKKKIVFSLNTGGKDFKSKIEMTEDKKTHHIFYPLAVLQEAIELKVKVDRFGKDDSLIDINIPVVDLIDDACKEVERKALPHLNLMVFLKATAYPLPYITIRQSNKEVTDYVDFFKIDELFGNDVRACPSGLVYFHIHRATNLPARDSDGRSDPYVVVFLDGKEIFKTKVVYNSCDPIFNHFEDLFVQNVLQSKITLRVWDRDEMSKDDEIGRLDLDLRDVVPKTINNAFQLKDKKVDAGSIFLSVIFRPIRLPTPDTNTTVVLENNIGNITQLSNS